MLFRENYEPCHEKTCLHGSRPGPKQPQIARGLKFRTWEVSLAKIKALISCAVTILSMASSVLIIYSDFIQLYS